MTVRPEPLRRCVACRRSRPKRELVRVARSPAGEVRVDPAGTAPGRGAYVCRDPECVDRALRRGGVARALGRGLGQDEATRLENALREAKERD